MLRRAGGNPVAAPLAALLVVISPALLLGARSTPMCRGGRLDSGRAPPLSGARLLIHLCVSRT
jgi:hypothetical protein